MKRRACSFLVALAVGGLALPITVAACSNGAATEPVESGNVKLPLTAVGNQGSTFQLVDAVFVITAADGTEMSLETNDFLGELAAEVTLPSGQHSVELLPGWTLQRQEQSEFAAVEATLTSDNPQAFTIVDGETTAIQVSFLAGDEIATGGGTLRVGIEVEEVGCEPPMLQCQGACVDPLSDVANCGGCGVACVTDQVCVDGICTDPFCNGDGVCDSDQETAETCYVDCGSCGDGLCTDGYETADDCYADCGACGDGLCTDGSETADDCYADCGACGDGICTDGSETADDCYADCGACGDGICTDGSEDANSCPSDCESSGAPCDDPIELDPSAATTGNFGTTDAVCYRIARTIGGWGISNMLGRVVSVNGVSMESQCPGAQGNCSMWSW